MRRLAEANVVRKGFGKAKLRVALCYPNIYRAGICSLAIQLIYRLLNAIPGVLCERAFFEEPGRPPRTLESGSLISEFDLVVFSVAYELDYVNLVRMLLDAGIPPLRDERGAEHPIVAVGGITVLENPRPLEPFVDLFFVGDAEPLLPVAIEAFLRHAPNLRAALEELAGEPGFYVPGLSEPPVRRVIVEDLDRAPAPTAQVLPLDPPPELEPVYGRAFMVEVSRGCPFWCRFCLLGYVSKPHRTRSLRSLRGIISEGLRLTPCDKVVLISSAIGSHPELEGLLSYLVEELHVQISIPAMRIDRLTPRIAELLRRGGQRTLTLAPETASPRLAAAIAKGIEPEDVIEAAKVALEAGLRQLKLYFMIGLPGERDEEVLMICDLVSSLRELGFRAPGAIRVSVNPMIPKPHTPFQWFPLAPAPVLSRRFRVLRARLAKMGVEVHGMTAREAEVQTLLSRGDASVARLILEAAERGSPSAIRILARRAGLLEHAHKELDPDQELPWDFVDVGIPKGVLRAHYERARGELGL